MRAFTLGKVTIICESMSARNGFKHVATLLINEYEAGTTKCMYQNRTWEYYQYQSVFHKMLNTSKLTKRQKTLFRKKYDGQRYSR